MKRLLFCILTALICTFNGKVSAQVLIDKSVIAVCPYFEKNDTMVYEYRNIEASITGTDTTYTHDSIEKFMLVCTKANDKKGYRLEQTVLAATNLLDNDSELNDIFMKAVTQGLLNLKTAFTIDGVGQNLAIENPAKYNKELTRRMQAICDSMQAIVPLLEPIIKQTMMGVTQTINANPTSMLNQFPEMKQLFEFHGNSFEYEQLKEADLDVDEVSTRPGKMSVIAKDIPEEGEEKQDWDDYSLTIKTSSYQDAMAAAIENAKNSTGKDITAEQVRLLLGDKTPSGEVECYEHLENEYFGDGWPKEMFYRKDCVQGDTTQIEIKEITWLTRSVGN